MFYLFDGIVGACLVIQQKLFGKYANLMWAYRILWITLGILCFISAYFLNRNFKLQPIIGIIFCIIVYFSLLFFYYNKRKPLEIDEVIKNFQDNSTIAKIGFITYVTLFFLLIPIIIISVLLWSKLKS